MSPTDLRFGSDSESDSDPTGNSESDPTYVRTYLRTDEAGQDVGLSGSFAERASARDEDPSHVEPNRGTCPVCHTARPLTNTGLIAHHKLATMRWSGRRWFRDTCTGQGKQPVAALKAEVEQ